MEETTQLEVKRNDWVLWKEDELLWIFLNVNFEFKKKGFTQTGRKLRT